MAKRLVDPNVLCMGCMKELNMPKEPCPYCGFYLPAYQQVKNSLPPYEILNGKYLVGKVIGVGGFGITYIGWDFYQSKRVCIKEYFPRGVASRGITETISHSSLTATLNVFTENTEQAKLISQMSVLSVGRKGGRSLKGKRTRKTVIERKKERK